MSKVTPMSIRQDKGLDKMISLIDVMIMDHHIHDVYIVGGVETQLKEIRSHLHTIKNQGAYTPYQKKYLNEVRNLVLKYKKSNKKKDVMPWDDPSYDDELTWAMNLNSMKLNSKGQIINRF